jgi:hypothetical protein
MKCDRTRVRQSNLDCINLACPPRGRPRNQMEVISLPDDKVKLSAMSWRTKYINLHLCRVIDPEASVSASSAISHGVILACDSVIRCGG